MLKQGKFLWILSTDYEPHEAAKQTQTLVKLHMTFSQVQFYSMEFWNSTSRYLHQSEMELHRLIKAVNSRAPCKSHTCCPDLHDVKVEVHETQRLRGDCHPQVFGRQHLVHITRCRLVHCSLCTGLMLWLVCRATKQQGEALRWILQRTSERLVQKCTLHAGWP